jgi:hypothetical protein
MIGNSFGLREIFLVKPDEDCWLIALTTTVLFSLTKE